MGYRVLLRRNSDGEKRLCHYPFDYSDFTWTEGNWSCDCNRELDFYRAKNEVPPKGESNDCLGSGAYSVVVVETDDGRCIFPDDTDDDQCIPDISVFDFSTLKSGEIRTIEFQPHRWTTSSSGTVHCDKCGEIRRI